MGAAKSTAKNREHSRKILGYAPFNSLLIPSLLLAHLFLLINLQFTAWPEMLSFPYLKANGFDLYADMVHPYPPLLTIVLEQIYKAFGFKIITLKIFTWSLILINDVLIYKIATKMSTKKAGYFALLFFILTQPFLEGNMLWFDTALVTPLLAGTLTLLSVKKKDKILAQKIILAGFFFALASLTKQTGGLYLVAAFLATRSTKFLYAPIFLWVVLLIKLFSEGSLLHFWNWVVHFPSKFWTSFPGYVDMGISNRELFILALLMAPVAWLFKNPKKNIRLISLFLVSLLSIYPRFSFFHAQALVALSAIAFGILSGKKTNTKSIALLLVAAVLVSYPAINLHWSTPTRFSEVQNLGKVESPIYLLGPNSAQYVYSETLPPKPWLDNFGWYWEVPGVANQTLKSWEQNPPTSIYISDVEPGAWHELGTYQPEKLVNWIEKNYTKGNRIEGNIQIWTKNP